MHGGFNYRNSGYIGLKYEAVHRFCCLYAVQFG